MQRDLVTLDDLDVRDRTVLVRVDLNVPLSGGTVVDDTRIRAALPTIRELLDRGATVVLASHLGRPKGPHDDARLGPVAASLSASLGRPVRYLPCDGPASEAQRAFVASAEPGSVTLLENTRFDPRETKNDRALASALAAYADLYVDDAFGAAHRAHASTEGVAHLLPSAAGRLVQREVAALTRLVDAPQRPFHVVLGGAKVSDKIGVIENLLPNIDALFVGGAMAYTFELARGGHVGASLVEIDKVDVARDLLARAKELGVAVHLPPDSVCATEVVAGAHTAVHGSDAIPEGWMGLDVGPETRRAWAEALAEAKTVLWNGPLGVFEVAPFDAGTRAIADVVARLEGYTVVGGGDSVAALVATGLVESIDHVSTGGGASLEFLEGAELPGLAVLARS